MTNALVPCSACRRHVRAHESVCPFCGVALDRDAMAARVSELAARAPAKRLGRAALFALGTSTAALGAATVSLVTGCSSETTDGKDDAGNVVALYGGPPVDAGSDDAKASGDSASNDASKTDAASDSAAGFDASDDSSAVALYGGPPVDAGRDADSGNVPVPAYGGPPQDSGAG
ncbi:MAG: hypothetical protein U0169_17905 [Polyangiaceae bacterium]